MALRTIAEILDRTNNPEIVGSSSNNVGAILKEIRGLKVAVVTGTTADTNIAISGIATEDTLLAVLGINGTGEEVLADTLVDLSATTSITSAGNIQCTDSTASWRLLVFWYDKNY
jgi:hypothetical protein